MFAKHKSVVSHVDDQGLIVNTHLFELVKNRPNAVIYGTKGLAIPLVVLLDIELAVVREINAMPTVSLIQQPAGKVLSVSLHQFLANWSLKRFG